jgi:hypothetical protein
MRYYIFGSNRFSDLHLLHSHSQYSDECLLIFLPLFTIHRYCATFFPTRKRKMFADLRTGILFAFPSILCHIFFLSLSNSLPHSLFLFLFLFLSLSLRIQGGWTRDGPRSTSPPTCSDSSLGPSSASSPSLTLSLSVSSAGYSPLNCSPSGLFAFITNAVIF